MLVDEIKNRVTLAMKSGDTVARDVLRLALGEIQTAEARKAAALSADEATAAVRKLIKSNEETLAAVGDADSRASALKHELEVLRALLPSQLTPAQIVDALKDQHAAIKAANNDGQATGIAMKHLKSTGASVDGKDVSAAVKQIRS
jgi:uncharacterized protein YqeY